MPDAQVIVVGGGPAGSSTAHFMARAGLDVLLLDRARFPRDKPCSEYMSPQASRLLAEMGALDAVESSGAAQLTGIRVHAPNGATIHGEFIAGHGYRGFSDRGLAVRRTILDAILLERARDAGVRIEEGVRVTDVVKDEAGRVVGVRASRAGGTSETINAPVVIGADGLRSVIGRRLGTLLPPQSRVLWLSTWKMLGFVLNGFAFMLIDGGRLYDKDVKKWTFNSAEAVSVASSATGPSRLERHPTPRPAEPINQPIEQAAPA